jgi:hypothetical protein
MEQDVPAFRRQDEAAGRQIGRLDKRTRGRDAVRELALREADIIFGAAFLPTRYRPRAASNPG